MCPQTSASGLRPVKLLRKTAPCELVQQAHAKPADMKSLIPNRSRIHKIMMRQFERTIR
jgi:hypothetical protein